MTEIAFYHLQRATLEQTLPRLLEKTLAAGKTALIMARSAERVQQLSAHLWTYEQNAFLPHGCDGDGSDPARQPIWLTDQDDNPNGGTFLFLVDGASSAQVADFERGFDLFDGNDPDAVKAARERWRALGEAGHQMTYWQQEEGGWRQKA